MVNIFWAVVGIVIIIFSFRKRPIDYDQTEILEIKSGFFGMFFHALYKLLPWWTWRIFEFILGLLIIYSTVKALFF